ncbi:hypothetical protein N7470_000642 [Penicillium chermesinum]|nr:hypothetical protein N7470_000642 [Penicillium chermesinum]
MDASPGLSHHLHGVLSTLYRRPYPQIPNPPACKKRASVALIIRIRPSDDCWPTDPVSSDPTESVEDRLDDFFAQPWVHHGIPEVLFIKRASRAGDRWTGHVALPGGKRDPEDEDDCAAAIREAWEEIGLDLTTDDCIAVGNLPERVVTTSWGSVPLRLQPTEVASTHWVPLKALLSPSLRTVEHVDMSQRYFKQAGFLGRMAIRSVVGWMQFSAVRLVPSETLYSTTMIDSVLEQGSEQKSVVQRLCGWCLSNQAESSDTSRPLLLWGLTLGVLADFLEMIPPHNAVKLWAYPTFTMPDLRLVASILSYRLRKLNAQKVKSGSRASNTASDSETTALPVSLSSHGTPMQETTGAGTQGVGRYYSATGQGGNGPSYAVGVLLQGYYQKLQTAIYIFLALRIAMGSAAAFAAWRFFRRRS